MPSVSELEKLFRWQVDDTTPEYRVSPDEFRVYLKEAQDEAVKRKNLLFDKSSAFCTVAVAAGKAVYPLHRSIYAIAYASIDGEPLEVKDRIDLDRLRPDWRTLSEKPCQLVHYDTSVELVPSPDKAYTLKLEAYRYPLCCDPDELEINQAHHRDLLHWVKYRAYSRPDIDIFDPDAAAKCERKFIGIFGYDVDGDDKRDWYGNVAHVNKPCY